MAHLYYKQISIDHTKITENLSNFPVLVRLNSDNFDFGPTQNYGQDIRFSAQQTWAAESGYAYEIETFDRNGERADIWVKIPFISSETDTIFYLHYGDAELPDAQDSYSVWSSPYKIVNHFSSAFTHNSASGNYISRVLNSPKRSSGIAGSGLFFDGTSSSSYILYSGITDWDLNDVYITEPFTVSLAIRRDNYVLDIGDIVGRNGPSGVGVNYTWRLYQHDYSGIVFDLLTTYGGRILKTETCYTDIAGPNYKYITAVYDTSGAYPGTCTHFIKLYIDGILVAASGSKSTSERLRMTYGPATPFTIGVRGDIPAWSPPPYYSGYIDEVRYNKSVLSSGWIYADYCSQSDQLLSVSYDYSIAYIPYKINAKITSLSNISYDVKAYKMVSYDSQFIIKANKGVNVDSAYKIHARIEALKDLYTLIKTRITSLYDSPYNVKANRLVTIGPEYKINARIEVLKNIANLIKTRITVYENLPYLIKSNITSLNYTKYKVNARRQIVRYISYYIKSHFGNYEDINYYIDVHTWMKFGDMRYFIRVFSIEEPISRIDIGYCIKAYRLNADIIPTILSFSYASGNYSGIAHINASGVLSNGTEKFWPASYYYKFIFSQIDYNEISGQYSGTGFDYIYREKVDKGFISATSQTFPGTNQPMMLYPSNSIDGSLISYASTSGSQTGWRGIIYDMGKSTMISCLRKYHADAWSFEKWNAECSNTLDGSWSLLVPTNQYDETLSAHWYLRAVSGAPNPCRYIKLNLFKGVIADRRLHEIEFYEFLGSEYLSFSTREVAVFISGISGVPIISKTFHQNIDMTNVATLDYIGMSPAINYISGSAGVDVAYSGKITRKSMYSGINEWENLSHRRFTYADTRKIY